MLPETLNLLVLTSNVPYPPTDGGRIAVFEPIRRLAERGHRITLLAFGSREAKDWSPLEQYCSLEVVGHDSANHILPAALNMMSQTPYTISKYKSSAMVARLRQRLASEAFDLVQVEHLHMGQYLPIIKEYGLPMLLRQQNVESVMTERFWRQARGLYRLYVGLQIAKLRRFEVQVCLQADACLMMTEVDAECLKRMNPHISTVVIPAGVDLTYYHPSPESNKENEIVFVGAMNWAPNIEAVLWFCGEIFPKVKRQLANVRLCIVGKDPPPSVRRLSSRPDVYVTGFVQDVRDYVAKASVFLVPLRVGSGMRLKILEAMAMGKAVISTRIGAEGIEAVDGQHILLADTADDFSASVIRLLTDANMRRHIGQNARRLVERRYSWNTMVDLTEQIYRDVIKNKKRG